MLNRFGSTEINSQLHASGLAPVNMNLYISTPSPAMSQMDFVLCSAATQIVCELVEIAIHLYCGVLY